MWLLLCGVVILFDTFFFFSFFKLTILALTHSSHLKPSERRVGTPVQSNRTLSADGEMKGAFGC